MKVKVEKIFYYPILNPTINHYSGRGHMMYDMEKYWWMVLAQGIWMESHQDWYDFCHYLLDWHFGGGFSVTIYRDTGGTNKVSFYYNSEVTTLTMAITKNGFKQGGKVEGVMQYWRIDSILLEQCG